MRKKILTATNQIKDWPGYDPRADEIENYEEVKGEKDLKSEVEKLNIKVWQLEKNFKEELNKRETLARSQKKELEEACHKMHQAGLDKERLLLAVEELESKLVKMGQPYEGLIFTEYEPTSKLPTIIIKTVPAEGTHRFGTTILEKNIPIITFDKDEAKKLKKLVISNCLKIIQLDLKYCVNLEKLTLNRSKWEKVLNISDCPLLKKVSVNNCENVPLDFLKGTNIEELKII